MSSQFATFHLRFDGALTIGWVSDAHGRLLEAARGASGTELDCSAAEEVDAAFVQLLVAARRTAQADTRDFRILAPADGALWKAAEDCGFGPTDLGLDTAADNAEGGAS